METKWYEISNADEVASPSLLIYPDRIDFNIQKMIEIAGSAERLRPHVKSHKMSEIIKMQLSYGITKFKCATIAEAEMVAISGGKDILLAIQPVGPNISRLFCLMKKYPDSSFSCIVDSDNIIDQLSFKAVNEGIDCHVWLDINSGMNRTGIQVGNQASNLYKRINSSPRLVDEGLHVYDGHTRESDFEIRKNLCDEDFKPVESMVHELIKSGIASIKIIAGGTPSFPVHALRKDIELSPGTSLIWDWGYGIKFPEMGFLHAAVLLTRVISRPDDDLLCIDLGHKAVASEMPHPRVIIPEIGDFTVSVHSEEHMVIRTRQAIRYKTGDIIYCIPWHICPTTDRHDFVSVVTDREVKTTWKVEARKRFISC